MEKEVGSSNFKKKHDQLQKFSIEKRSVTLIFYTNVVIYTNYQLKSNWLLKFFNAKVVDYKHFNIKVCGYTNFK